MNLRYALKSAALVIALALSEPAAAQTYTTLTLPQLNANLTTWTNGTAYNGLFPSSQIFAGVPFELQSDMLGNNAFNGLGTTVIPVGVYGVTDVYTLINSAWGYSYAQVGSITFEGSAGASHSVLLIEGDNVRDHYYGSYVNTTTAAYVTESVWGQNVPGTAHLDMQDFALPAAFATQTLTSITFFSSGSTNGSPFIAGATVAAVPEPETYAALIAGLAILAAYRRKRRPAT